MIKSFRFLLQFAWVNLGAVIAFAAVVIGGCYATGVPGGSDIHNLFETYYAMLPTMVLLCLFLFAFALCTNNLNLGLSLGGRRRDFFWALQGILVFYAVVSWALQLFLAILPLAANWTVRGRWSLLTMYQGKPLAYPLLCTAIMILGCLSGMLMVRSKVLGTLVVILSMLILMGATIVMILWSNTSIMDFLYEVQWSWLWTRLPQILTAVMAVSAVGGELLIWRTIRRYAVR